MRIKAIACNTFRETIRDRILLNILLFALGLILLALVIGEWSIYQQVKVLKDFGLSAMSIFGLLIAIFIGIRLMVQETEQRTLYLIASKPVHRWEIVLGKYIGLCMTLVINVAIMACTLLLVVLLKEGNLDLSLMPAVFLITLEIVLIVAFALLFSSFTSPTLSAILTLIVFVIGHMSGFLREYIQLYPDRGFHWLFKAMYFVLPNLENLNMKMAAVEHLKQPPHAVLYGCIYGIAYTAVILILTMAIFQKKDLK